MDAATVVDGAPGATDPPAARALQRRLRGVRRAHHAGSLGDVLTDVYIILLIVALYGFTVPRAVRGYLASPAVQATDAGTRYWIAVAVAMAVTGLAWQGLRVVGPLLVTPAAQTWVFSSPVHRGDLLAPRFAALVLGAVVGIGTRAWPSGSRAGPAWSGRPAPVPPPG